MSYGFSSKYDNAELPKRAFANFKRMYCRLMDWSKPSDNEIRIGSVVTADLFAQTADLTPPAQVYEFFYQGFPDPDRFLFVQKQTNGDLLATGYFDTWPDCWKLTIAH